MVFAKIRLSPHGLPLALLTALLLVFLAIFLRTELRLTNGRLGVPLDDAWIHYQFARNLAQGHGFSYNPGIPMPGSTAPLWTILMAGVGLFTSDFLLPSLLLSAFFLLLTTWFTYGFMLDLVEHTGIKWAFLAGLGVILTGRLLWAGLAGMETTAFAAVSVAAVWAYHRQGLRPLAALLFALSSQLRPEGHALFALAAADSVLTAYLARNQLPIWSLGRKLLVALLIYGLVNAPYALFSLSVTGHPLPNTFYAKAGAEYLFSWRTLRETIAHHWQDNPVAYFLIALGLVATAKRSRIVVGWLLGLPLLVSFIIDLTWHHGRYTIPLIPFQMIVAALGAEWVAQRLVRLNSKWLVPGLIYSLMLVGGLQHFIDWARMLGTNSNEILEIDVALGHWLAANTPPDALLAIDDIGAITFISQRHILDLQGLVSPEMWPAIRGEVGGLPRSQAAVRILSTIQPDYLAIFPVWHWEISANPAVVTPVQRFWVDTHTIIFDQEAMVYQPTWPYQPKATPQTALSAKLGTAIQLMGYDFNPHPIDDHMLTLTLYWQSLAAVSESYDVFVHVLTEEGNIVAQGDQQPVGALAPTDRWQAGDIIRDPYMIHMPTNLPTGTYDLSVGMYLRDSGMRLPIANTPNDAFYLTSFIWPQ